MTKAEWQPDINISTAIAKNAIAAEFPEIAPIKTIKLIGEGWDNKVFLINQSRLFSDSRNETKDLNLLNKKIAYQAILIQTRSLNLPFLTHNL